MKNDKIIFCLKLCRPEHSIKNFLVLLPPFFGRRMLSFNTLADCFIALLSFSLIASSVYILNDIFDREKDKIHPTKRNRPVASGKVSLSTATAIMLLCALSGCVLTLLYTESCSALLLAGAYLVINIAYSLSLKNKPVTDVFILASGFVLRVYFGGAFFNVTISPWLFLCVLCGSLCFAVGKRRNELLFSSAADNSRPALKYYTGNYLNSSYFLLCGMTIVFFSLWTIFAVKHNIFLQFSIPVAMFIMFRYNLIIEKKNADGDPVSTVLKDKTLVVLAFLFAIMSFVGVYFV